MNRFRPIAVCVTIVALTGALTACGGSSSAKPAASAAVATPGGPSGPRGAGRFRDPARRAAIAACLRKQGVTLPRFSPGGPPPQISAAQRAALTSCGLRRFGAGPGRFRNNPAFRARLTAFAACMTSSGVKLAAPNTSGSGPIFGNVNRSDPKFQTAYAKCSAKLGGLFGPRAGAPPGAGGPPPGGG